VLRPVRGALPWVELELHIISIETIPRRSKLSPYLPQ
jgi:hypothetical protein